jgi:hypothetical protein
VRGARRQRTADEHVKAAAGQLALGHPAELRVLLDGAFHGAVDHLSDALRLCPESELGRGTCFWFELPVAG